MQEEKEIQDTSTYKSIFKATSILGSVQIWQILIGIIRNKIIAILIGTTGMGISGLYTSAIQLIQSLTSMGLSTSAVKNIAEANTTGDGKRISVVVTAFNKLVWMTGLLGVVCMILFSPLLSKSSFGNYDYIVPFVLLSVNLLLLQLSSGQLVVLQGFRKIKDLAKASFLGSLIGFLFSVPIYCFFRLDGIIPTLILYEVMRLLLTSIFVRKLKIEKAKLNVKEVFTEGKGMLGMGIAMSINGILAYFIAFFVRSFISSVGGVDQVGLYTAGLNVVNMYVGMVFTAMASDFFPRLSQVNKDNSKCSSLISQQAEIATLIIAPLVGIFIPLSPVIVALLYTKEFLNISLFMQFAMMGMLLKAGSWSISYIYLAKSDMKIFLYNEVSTKVINLVMSVTLYYLWGLNGLGVAFVIDQIAYFVVVYIVAKRKYNFSFSQAYSKLLLICLPLVSTIQLTMMFLTGLIKYFAACAVCIIISCYCLTELNKRVGIAKFILNKKNKNTR